MRGKFEKEAIEVILNTTDLIDALMKKIDENEVRLFKINNKVEKYQENREFTKINDCLVELIEINGESKAFKWLVKYLKENMD